MGTSCKATRPIKDCPQHILPLMLVDLFRTSPLSAAPDSPTLSMTLIKGRLSVICNLLLCLGSFRKKLRTCHHIAWYLRSTLLIFMFWHCLVASIVSVWRWRTPSYSSWTPPPCILPRHIPYLPCFSDNYHPTQLYRLFSLTQNSIVCFIVRRRRTIVWHSVLIQTHLYKLVNVIGIWFLSVRIRNDQNLSDNFHARRYIHMRHKICMFSEVLVHSKHV